MKYDPDRPPGSAAVKMVMGGWKKVMSPDLKHSLVSGGVFALLLIGALCIMSRRAPIDVSDVSFYGRPWLMGAPEKKVPDAASVDEAVIAQELVPTSISDDVETLPLCVDRSPDFIPCLDNIAAIKALPSRHHYQHRERHCPTLEEGLRCLLPLPQGYKAHVPWPESRDQIWYNNVPHSQLANYKSDQNWLKQDGDRFVFPGGGTQFKHGATQYITWLQESVPELSWGRRIRVMLDMGCGVASFGAYLDAFNVRVLSVAPKDEHDAQIQFALERGVSALVGVMGTQRQPMPAGSFDAVHCARCRVPWHADGGRLLLELNRLLRPGGYFVWSASPVCLDCKAKEKDDKEIWEAVSSLAESMCWKRVAKVISNEMGIGVAVWQKPISNECYDSRPKDSLPPMCPTEGNPDAAWYNLMLSCMHRIPTSVVSSVEWPAEGEVRLTATPADRPGSGFIPSPVPAAGQTDSETEDSTLTQADSDTTEGGSSREEFREEFKMDTEHWSRVVDSYVTGLGIEWTTVRNVMDLNANYGGFAAALETRVPAWVMNVVPTTASDTLSVVYNRGLLGVYHNWCESFNTYPRTYDLLHSDHMLSGIISSDRCDLTLVMVELDRILRPDGFVILREKALHLDSIVTAARQMQWTLLKDSQDTAEVLLVFRKTFWRPQLDQDTSQA